MNRKKVSSMKNQNWRYTICMADRRRHAVIIACFSKTWPSLLDIMDENKVRKEIVWESREGGDLREYARNGVLVNLGLCHLWSLPWMWRGQEPGSIPGGDWNVDVSNRPTVRDRGHLRRKRHFRCPWTYYLLSLFSSLGRAINWEVFHLSWCNDNEKPSAPSDAQSESSV